MFRFALLSFALAACEGDKDNNPSSDDSASDDTGTKVWECVLPKDAVDPDLTEVSYDDGDPEPLQLIKDAIAAGIPADAWYPVY